MTARSCTGWTEAERLAALEDYAILDTPAESNFDDIVKLVGQLIDAPIAAVNLIGEDRQWFKSEIGLGVREMPLDDSICKFALLQDDSMIIPDTLEDSRTSCNPLVTGEPGLRFYAGELLKTPDGLPLGTLCALDTKPRPLGLTPQQRFALKTLSRQVQTLIEMHRITRAQKAELDEKERLKAEAHAGRERFQKLVGQAATGIIETDADACITLVNQKMCEMLGYTEAELVGKSVGDITHATSMSRTQALIDSLIAGGGSRIIEKQYRRKDDSLMWATSSVNALRSEDGRFQGMVANIVDITDRKQAESALRISEERFRSLVTATSQVIWTADGEGRIHEDSPSWRKFTGQSYDQWKGDGWLDVVHQDDRHQVADVWKLSIRNKTHHANEFRIRHADGSYRWIAVRAVPLFNTDGSVREWIGTNTDITEARHAQEAIKTSEERLHFALKAGSMAAWDWNLVTGHTNRVNMFSLVPDLMTGQAEEFFSLMHPEDREKHSRAIELAKTGQAPYDFEFRMLAPDGRVIWIADKAQLRTDPSDGQPHLTGVSMDVTARRQAEHDRQQFVSLAEHSNEFIGMADADLNLYFINSAAVKMVGLESAEQALSLPLSDFFFPEDRAFVFDEFLPHAIQKGNAEIEIRFRHFQSGTAIWMIYSVYVVQDAHGNVTGHATVSRNITDRKQHEAALQDAQARLEATLAAGEVSTWIYDINANRLFADRNLARLFAVSEHHVNGGPLKPYLNAIHPDDIDQVHQHIQDAIRTGKPYQSSYRVRGPNGEWRFVIARGKVEYDLSGSPARMPGVVLDVTQQKLAEQALQAKEERYGALFNAIDEGFSIVEIITDANDIPIDYRFLEANPAFEKHSGLSDVVGKTARELVPDLEQRWIDLYSNVALSGEPVRLIEQSLPMGRWFDVHASRLGGMYSRKVAILFNDITEQKQNDANLRKLAADLAESNQRKTEFLATLAHELRNPLAPIRSGLDLVALGQNSSDTVARVCEMMGRQVDHMTHLVNDLLDVARINSGKVELRKSRIELKAVIASAVETSMPLVKEKHHELAVALPDEALWLDADITRLTQILGNLLSNAAKYTPANGHITLAARRENGEAVILITDSGIGIPAESLPDVFNLFTQVRRSMPHAQGGLGIGLSLVQRLVELHDGTVTASSSGLGHGSEFVVRLPLARLDVTPNVPYDTAVKDPELPERRQLRILVVDDNVDAAATLAELLRMLGHLVNVSTDGCEALQLARAFRPDVAMLDLGMPGMTGYEIAQAMRKMPETQQARLAAITGWGALEDRVRTRAAGFDHHLTKPVDLKALDELLSSVSSTLVD